MGATACTLFLVAFGSTSMRQAQAPAPKPLLRASAKLSYQRVSELEARIYSRQLLRYSNLGLDGESDMQATSVVTGALVVGGAASGALAVQELPGPDIVRWCVSALLICSPFFFLTLGLTSPTVVQRAISSVRRLSPAYRARMLRHEAGHFMVGHLVGLPVVSFSANAASSAVECGLPVYAQAEDEGTTNLLPQEDELNRFAVVSLAGIVAECLCFGQAEGGLADLSALNREQMRARVLGDDDERNEDERNRVRWAAVQAYALLHGNGAAFERLVCAMSAGLTVAQCEAALEGQESHSARAALEQWAYDGMWPVERAKAKARTHPRRAQGQAMTSSDETVAALSAFFRWAREAVVRDPYLSATVVAMLGAIALVLEAVAKGTPLN